jgi:hypothetical protein
MFKTIIHNNKWQITLKKLEFTNFLTCDYTSMKTIKNKIALCTEILPSFENQLPGLMSEKDLLILKHSHLQLFTHHPQNRPHQLISTNNFKGEPVNQYLNIKGYSLPKDAKCFKLIDDFNTNSFFENNTAELTDFLLNHTIDSSNNLILDNFQNLLY